jgi:tetratricopeptide (TPR) repeat protein
LAHDRLETALSSLFDFIEENGEYLEIWDRSLTLQQIGDIFFKLGRRNLAKFYFDISLEMNRNSLVAKLGYARFIGNRLNDRERASMICDEIIAAARSAPGAHFNESTSANNFISRAESLRAELGIPGTARGDSGDE